MNRWKKPSLLLTPFLPFHKILQDLNTPRLSKAWDIPCTLFLSVAALLRNFNLLFAFGLFVDKTFIRAFLQLDL